MTVHQASYRMLLSVAALSAVMLAPAQAELISFGAANTRIGTNVMPNVEISSDGFDSGFGSGTLAAVTEASMPDRCR